MKKENIVEMIDKRIIQSFVDGNSYQVVLDELNTRAKNMIDVIESQKLDLNKLLDIEFDQLSAADFSDEKISVTRIKYTTFYIKHSLKRIEDLKWVEKNKPLFPHLSKSQVFKLLKFKEKLQEDSLPF